jgi:GxxExxY protein
MITAIEEKNMAEIKERDPLTARIIACAYRVHSQLGPGLNEKIYHNALKIALESEGLSFKTETEFKVSYQDKQVGALRIDLVVDNKIIVEVKAVLGMMPKVFESQVLSYLKITGCGVGLLINFGNKSCQVRRLMYKS